MGTKQILPTRFLHLPEVTSPGQTMNLQHISRCGKQTNHFPNFLPEEKENFPFFFPLPDKVSSPGVPDSSRHSLTWFTDHITLRPDWTSEHANFFFFLGGRGANPSSLHSRKKPYLVVLAAALKAPTQIFIRLILDSEDVFPRRRKVSEVPLRASRDHKKIFLFLF